MPIRTVVPTTLSSGSVVFAATDDNGAATRGLYRSGDSGVAWTRVSGTGGLPNARVTDLAADPSNANRFYAALPGLGVYLSSDGGLNWTAVNTGLTELATTGRLRLSVHNNAAAGTNAVYAGFIGTNGRLQDVFRTTNQGTSWAVLGTAPAIYLSAQGQGLTHFSIVADPTNANVVFVGG